MKLTRVGNGKGIKQDFVELETGDTILAVENGLVSDVMKVHKTNFTDAFATSETCYVQLKKISLGIMRIPGGYQVEERHPYTSVRGYEPPFRYLCVTEAMAKELPVGSDVDL